MTSGTALSTPTGRWQSVAGAWLAEVHQDVLGLQGHTARIHSPGRLDSPTVSVPLFDLILNRMFRYEKSAKGGQISDTLFLMDKMGPSRATHRPGLHSRRNDG